MGRKNGKWTDFDYFLFGLFFLISLICVYPIILMIVVFGIIIWLLIVYFDNKQEKKHKEKLINQVENIKEQESGVKNSNSYENNFMFSFDEILNICDDIENKLLEVEVSYAELEVENEDISDLFYQLEEYEGIIDEFRNKKLIDLNDDLVEELYDSYSEFMSLYDEFNELVDSSFEKVIEETNLDYKKEILDKYKRMKEKEEQEAELEKEAYRDELRYVWGLTEYQIGLVESGEYEPGQFSEEELEEDDYYSEDE